MMDLKKLKRATKHLHRCYELYYIWELGVINSSYSKLFYKNDVLGIMSYNVYQMLVIKLNILFENKGKHSILLLVKSLQDGKHIKEATRLFKLIRRKHSKAIANIEWLRNKYYAHYDDVELTDVQYKYLGRDELLKLLNEIELVMILMWYNSTGEIPHKFENIGFSHSVAKTFKSLLPEKKTVGINYETDII